MEFSIPLLIWLSASSVFFDDFERSDRAIAGDLAESGQAWVSFDTEGHGIRNGRYVNLETTPHTPAAHIDLDGPPSVISADIYFSAGEKFNQVAVFGAGRGDLFEGSIKLLVYRNQWRLSAVHIPATSPAPLLAAGIFEPMLEIDTPYHMTMRWNHADSVSIELPQTAPRTVTHRFIGEYWGRTVGILVDRQTRKSGTAEFAGVSAE